VAFFSFLIIEVRFFGQVCFRKEGGGGSVARATACFPHRLCAPDSIVMLITNRRNVPLEFRRVSPAAAIAVGTECPAEHANGLQRQSETHVSV
jgi:hypothetical protein